MFEHIFGYGRFIDFREMCRDTNESDKKLFKITLVFARFRILKTQINVISLDSSKNQSKRSTLSNIVTSIQEDKINK